MEASRAYATKPHMAGTVGDLATAREFLELLQRELGISDTHPEDVVFKAGSADSQRATRSVSKTNKPYAWIDTYYPVMNTPKERILEIVDDDGKSLVRTSMVEFSDPTDPDASKYNDDVPTFHGLSRGGDVTGLLVDGNYCTYEVCANLQACNSSEFAFISFVRITNNSFRTVSSSHIIMITHLIFKKKKLRSMAPSSYAVTVAYSVA